MTTRHKGKQDDIIITTHPNPMGIMPASQVLVALERQRQNNSGPKTYMSVRDVAEMIGRDPKTIRRWTEREHHPLPVIKKPCGKQCTWLFERSEVLEWFEIFKQK